MIWGMDEIGDDWGENKNNVSQLQYVTVFKQVGQMYLKMLDKLGLAMLHLLTPSRMNQAL